MPDKEETINLYRACICGATWKLNANFLGTMKLAEVMEQMHVGEGHAPCTSQEAARVRDRLDRQESEE